MSYGRNQSIIRFSLIGVVLVLLVMTEYDKNISVIRQYYQLISSAETGQVREAIKTYLDEDLFQSIEMLGFMLLGSHWQTGAPVASDRELERVRMMADSIFRQQEVEEIYIMVPMSAGQSGFTAGSPARWKYAHIVPGNPVTGDFSTAQTLADPVAAALDRQWDWLYAGQDPIASGQRYSYRTELIPATVPGRQSPAALQNSGKLLYSMPVFTGQGQAAVMITALLDLSVLSRYFYQPNYVLHHANHALLVVPNEDGYWRQAKPWPAAPVSAPEAIYNETVEMSLADASGSWQLWAGEAENLFWSRLDVRSARHLVAIALAMIVFMTIALNIYNIFIYRKKHRIIERNKELEAEVKQRTAQLQQSLLEAERMAGMVRRDKDELHAILDSTADSIIAADAQGIIEYIGRATERMFGYTAEQLVGNNINILMPADVAINHDQFLLSHNGSESIMLGEGNRELMAQRSDGSLFDAEISIASTMFSGQRKFIAVIRDISRRRKAEQKQQALGEQLEEMQKQLMQNEKMAAIGQLAAGVAHEINNPVGYIASNITVLDGYIQGLTKLIEAYEASEVLLIQVEGNHGLGLIGELKRKLDIEYLLKDAVELIKESQEGVARVKKIVQDLKDFSHVDEPVWQWANIHLGLDSTLNVVNNELKYKADVIKEYGELPEIECIPSQLNQVFMNLLVNAAHAIEVHGTITIRTGVDDQQGQVWVEIADSGKGIEAENLSRIFDPFYTSKPVGQGTGLGLSLSYGIIDAHHGVIKVESEVGQGTTFRIWLPIEQAEDELLANAASS